MDSSTLSEVQSALISGLVAIIIAMLPILGSKVSEYISAKWELAKASKDGEKYKLYLKQAWNVWMIVEEYGRLSPIKLSVDEKINKFNEQMLLIVPGLTQDEIDHLRQAIAGEVNKAKTAAYAEIMTEDKDDIPAVIAPAVETSVDQTQTVAAAEGATTQ